MRLGPITTQTAPEERLGGATLFSGCRRSRLTDSLTLLSMNQALTYDNLGGIESMRRSSATLGASTRMIGSGPCVEHLINLSNPIEHPLERWVIDTVNDRMIIFGARVGENAA